MTPRRERQHRRLYRADDDAPRLDYVIHWNKRAFERCVLQLIVFSLNDFQPRVLIDSIQLIALPPGRNLSQVPDIVADRRRPKIAPAYTLPANDPCVCELPDRFHVGIKQAREALPGYTFGH